MSNYDILAAFRTSINVGVRESERLEKSINDKEVSERLKTEMTSEIYSDNFENILSGIISQSPDLGTLQQNVNTFIETIVDELIKDGERIKKIKKLIN